MVVTLRGPALFFLLWGEEEEKGVAADVDGGSAGGWGVN